MGLTERSFLERMELMGFTTTRAITNADRIRSMTDEELAEMLTDIGVRTLRLHNLPVTEPVIEQAKEDWRDWLRKEVEG